MRCEARCRAAASARSVGAVGPGGHRVPPSGRSAQSFGPAFLIASLAWSANLAKFLWNSDARCLAFSS